MAPVCFSCKEVAHTYRPNAMMTPPAFRNSKVLREPVRTCPFNGLSLAKLVCESPFFARSFAKQRRDIRLRYSHPKENFIACFEGRSAAVRLTPLFCSSQPHRPPSGLRAHYRLHGLPFLERQADAKPEEDCADDASLPAANPAVLAQPPAEGSGCKGDHRGVGGAHSREHQP